MTKDIEHKRKTINDLIRFVKNSPERLDTLGNRTANFSLLLGAGASVSSDIRSGGQLIQDWKKEVYEESGVEGITMEDFFINGKAPKWYEKENEYASLFENRYDLQSHRRMFVEREVAQKEPAIGYAYLVKIIENGYFNTVFTTNFDDLLNEAFYRFSHKRPIVCAHDSSINGVTITSSRPKIIKLHGDYLFDNIKATIRETESLETNMKQKFQEFAKDFGLIVIGYSGQDRSIMDILNYLLQKEEYFKNGIFWCIRKGEDPCSELKKLLWKDRVYFVEIDGFDELMAEMNSALNSGALPVDDSFLSRNHQQSVIMSLTQNSYIRDTTCEILRNDFKKLQEKYKESIAVDFVKFIQDQKKEQTQKDIRRNPVRKTSLRQMTDSEAKDLESMINEAYMLGHRNMVRKNLETKELLSCEDSRFKLEQLELLTDLSPDLSDDLLQIYFDELIRLNPNNQRYYEIVANRLKDTQKSLDYLKKACSIFTHDSYIFDLYIDRALDFCEEMLDINSRNDKLREILNLCDNCSTLNSSIVNKITLGKIRCINLLYYNQRDELDCKLSQIRSELDKITYKHSLLLKLLKCVSSNKYNENEIRETIEYAKSADSSSMVEDSYQELIRWKENNATEEDVLKVYDEFEEEYEPSDEFLYQKGLYLMKHEYFEDALAIFNKLPKQRYSESKKLQLYYLLHKHDEYEKLRAQRLESEENLMEHYETIGDYEALYNIYSTWPEGSAKWNKTRRINYSFCLLKLEKWDAAQNLLKCYYENPCTADASIIVNYLYARHKNTGAKIEKQVREKIIDNKYIQYSDYDMLGAYCLLEDKDQVAKYLGKELKNNPMSKYIISEWPIIQSIKSDKRISRLLEKNHKKLK